MDSEELKKRREESLSEYVNVHPSCPENQMPQIISKKYYSGRNDILKVHDSIQIENLDKRTRISIFNFVYNHVDWEYLETYYCNERIRDFILYILFEIIRYKVTDLPHNEYVFRCKQDVERIIEFGSYDQVFSLLEIISEFFDAREVSEKVNEIFEKENVGYKMVNGMIVNSISDADIESIEKACNLSDSFNTCSNHMEKAFNFLYDRENPDYQNSIKESVTAIESACQLITGKDLEAGKLLTQMSSQKLIEPALATAFSNIYGFASTIKGGRHSNSNNGRQSDLEEAKLIFFLCSAMLNYLYFHHHDNTQ